MTTPQKLYTWVVGLVTLGALVLWGCYGFVIITYRSFPQSLWLYMIAAGGIGGVLLVTLIHNVREKRLNTWSTIVQCIVFAATIYGVPLGILGLVLLWVQGRQSKRCQLADDRHLESPGKVS